MSRLTKTSNKGGTALNFEVDITDNNGCMKNLVEVFKKLKHYEDLEDQGKINNNQWISVNDTLPKDFVNVLTCDKKGNMHIFSHCKGYEYPFCIPPDHTRYYMPVAWQPLPKAYKEA